MECRLLQPFGAEISGFDLSSATAAGVSDISCMIARHGVVVFRSQAISDAALVCFLKLIGELTFTAGEVPVEGSTELNVVSNVGRTTAPRSVFHTDTSDVDRPPSFGVLKSVMVPRAGGSTLFSDQVDAVARLSQRVTAWLSGRTIEHSATGPGGQLRSARHPVLRRHPTTGKMILFLSTPERCKALSGVDEMTSKRVISLLYRRSIKASRLYRHGWQNGDVVCWDNRSTMHRADHGSVLGDRVLHRGLILGEIPLQA